MNFTKIFLPTDYACCNKTEMVLPLCHFASGTMQFCDCISCTRTRTEGFSVFFQMRVWGCAFRQPLVPW